MKRAFWTLFAVVLALVLGMPVGAQQAGAQVVAIHTLGDVPLATLQNTIIPGSITDDRGFRLGGIGSDMWHGPGMAANEFYLVTDRGPNGQIRVEGANRRTFPVPDFTPLIMLVRLEANGEISVLQAIPIVGQSGKPVTGMSNQARDEKPYDYSAQNEFPLNPNGLDTEGLVRAPNGDFWLVDEYSPSIVHVDPSGKVIKRYVPQGINLTGTDYPVAETLPAIYGKRKVNRGFEGLGISADGRLLYVALQSPLLNPDRATGDASRNTRILVFDAVAERAVAEYVYHFDVAAQFDPKSPAPAEMKLSGVVALNRDTLLILERTDLVAKLYAVNMSRATNILGSLWSDPATKPAMEAFDDPFAAAQISPLPKTLVLDLDTLPDMPDKIEGIAVLDKNTIVVVNDNDFDINDGKFDSAGRFSGPGAKSKILTIRTAAAIPGM